MKTILIIIILTTLFGCATIAPEQNPIAMQIVDKCADNRRSENLFNAKKTIQLIRYECRQLLSLDHNYLKASNQAFERTFFKHKTIQQYIFDDKTWFLVTEVIRKKYYPEYMDPESEVIRAKLLEEEQAKTLVDQSSRRHFAPRLLPVSPYLMGYDLLTRANEVTDNLLFENKNNIEVCDELKVIRKIIGDEEKRRDPFVYHPAL
jgi:hypothetical protein